jgi:anti-sigma factor RsiW
MNDDLYNDLLEASWHRKLTADEEAQLRGWLAGHPDRQPEWEEELALNQQLDRLPNAPLASNFTAQVLGKLDLELQREGREAKAGRGGVTSWWRGLVPRFAAVLLAGLLAGTAIVQYREHQRSEMVQDVMHMTPVASVLSPDVLQNFDAIHQLSHVPAISEAELLAALQ